MENLDEEEARVKNLHNKLKKSYHHRSDLEREKSISLDADLNEKEYWVKKMNY